MNGISPLLASILLIAITVTAATIVSGWTTSALATAQRGTDNKTSSALACSSAALAIDSVFITPGNNATASVVVRNSGSVDNLVVSSAQLYDKLGNNFSTINTLTLNVGQTGTLSFRMPYNNNITLNSALKANNGTCLGMKLANESCSYTLSGKFAGGMAFIGANDYVDVPSTSVLDIRQEITVMAWLKASNNGSWQRPVQKFDVSASVPPYAITLNQGGTPYGWGCEFVDETNSVYIQISDDEARAGTWYHVACTGSQSGNYTQLYVDGLVKNSTAWFSNNQLIRIMSATSLKMGRARAEVNGGFNGTLDEVQIWNRSLTGAEINGSMSFGAGNVSNQNDLVGYWKFDEGTGILSCPVDFSSVRVTTQCADATDVYTARPQC
ncbi:MAG: LamG domain-containing protein [Candidatus Aenigmarchaeota archaeon]|nr:LamG domain-containing protein [Candidatus Aenigmarchaeota archaeon]